MCADVLNQLAGTAGAPRALHAAIFRVQPPEQRRSRRALRPAGQGRAALPPPQRRIPAAHRPVLPLLQQLLRARSLPNPVP